MVDIPSELMLEHNVAVVWRCRNCKSFNLFDIDKENRVATCIWCGMHLRVLIHA